MKSIKNTLNKYQDFIINNMRKNKISKIIIISAPLPTIKKYSLNNESEILDQK